MKLLIIDYLHIGEGLVTSIVLGIMSYIFRYICKFSHTNTIIFAWFVTWIFRRTYLNIAKHVSNYNKLKEKKEIYINI